MGKIKVISWGLGAMGSGIAKMIIEKQDIEIVGAIDKDPSKLGKDLGEILGLNRKINVTIQDNLKDVIKNRKADIVILAIDSFIKNVFPCIKQIVENKINCVTLAEEMAYPFEVNKKLSKIMDKTAKGKGVTILGTGVNPGFVLDTLIITLSAACKNVESITARRVNDLSPFGLTVMKTQGVGTTLEEFEDGLKNGNIVGHIGFRQSIPMISKALGLEIDEIIETREPIISNTYRETPCIKVQPGMVAGCNHTAYGKKNGETIITLEHPQQICPQSECIETGDYIDIKGENDMHLCIQPETPGGIGTIAMAVNVIPLVMAAKPGLKTMIDIPIPHSIQNSFESQLKYYKGE